MNQETTNVGTTPSVIIYDGVLEVLASEFCYSHKSYLYLLSNGLWYFESDLKSIHSSVW